MAALVYIVQDPQNHSRAPHLKARPGRLHDAPLYKGKPTPHGLTIGLRVGAAAVSKLRGTRDQNGVLPYHPVTHHGVTHFEAGDVPLHPAPADQLTAAEGAGPILGPRAVVTDGAAGVTSDAGDG